MNIKNSLFSIATILLFASYAYSQTEVYVDENMNNISKSIYLQKCNSNVLYCLNYKTDSIIVNKIHNRYKFGKINKEKVEQIRILLSKRGSIEIPQEQTIIIKHSDTLGMSYQSYLKNLKKPNLREGKLLTERQLKRNHKLWFNRLKKCTKRYENKEKSKVFYSYNHLSIKNDDLKTLNLIPHDSTIWSVFFDKIHNPRFVIIKPNGEYFLSNSLIPSKALDILVNSKDWNIHRNDLVATKTVHQKKGHGIFRGVVSINQEILLCF